MVPHVERIELRIGIDGDFIVDEKADARGRFPGMARDFFQAFSNFT
jgi:hypothetical protein